MDSDKENPLGVCQFQIEFINILKTDIKTSQELMADVIEMLEYWLYQRRKVTEDINQLYHPNTSNGFFEKQGKLLASGVTIASTAVMLHPKMATAAVVGCASLAPAVVGAAALSPAVGCAGLVATTLLGGFAAGMDNGKIKNDTFILTKTRNLLEDDYLESCGLQKLVSEYLLQLKEVQNSVINIINSYHREVDTNITPQCLGYTSLLNIITRWLQGDLNDESLWDAFQRSVYTCEEIRQKLEPFECMLNKFIEFKIQLEKMQPDLKTESIFGKVCGFVQNSTGFWRSEAPKANDSITYNFPPKNTIAMKKVENIQQFPATSTPGYQNVTPVASLRNFDAYQEFVEDPTEKWTKTVLTELTSGIYEAEQISQTLKVYA